MIDFKEEILKFKPAMEIDDIEEKIADTDLKDLLEILKRLV